LLWTPCRPLASDCILGCILGLYPGFVSWLTSQHVLLRQEEKQLSIVPALSGARQTSNWQYYSLLLQLLQQDLALVLKLLPVLMQTHEVRNSLQNKRIQVLPLCFKALQSFLR